MSSMNTSKGIVVDAIEIIKTQISPLQENKTYKNEIYEKVNENESNDKFEIENGFEVEFEQQNHQQIYIANELHVNPTFCHRFWFLYIPNIAIFTLFFGLLLIMIDNPQCNDGCKKKSCYTTDTRHHKHTHQCTCYDSFQNMTCDVSKQTIISFIGLYFVIFSFFSIFFMIILLFLYYKYYKILPNHNLLVETSIFPNINFNKSLKTLFLRNNE